MLGHTPQLLVRATFAWMTALLQCAMSEISLWLCWGLKKHLAALWLLEALTVDLTFLEFCASLFLQTLRTWFQKELQIALFSKKRTLDHCFVWFQSVLTQGTRMIWPKSLMCGDQPQPAHTLQLPFHILLKKHSMYYLCTWWCSFLYFDLTFHYYFR